MLLSTKRARDAEQCALCKLMPSPLPEQVFQPGIDFGRKEYKNHRLELQQLVQRVFFPQLA